MIKIATFLISLAVLFSALEVCAQVVAPTPDLAAQAQRRANEMNQREAEMERIKNGRANGSKNISNSFRILRLTEKDKLAISLHPADAEKFAGLLKAPETGFVRLYDSSKCEMNRRIINVNDPCPPNIAGRATSYSFRQKKYQTLVYSDISFENGRLKIAGINVLGFITNLGDVSLEGASLNSDGIRDLASYQPFSDFREVQRAFKVVERGFRVGDFSYRNVAALEENSTYAIRAVAYDGKVIARSGRFKFNILDRDKRDDVIVVFRPIRRHEDGSVSLLWRILFRQDAPKIDTKNKK